MFLICKWCSAMWLFLSPFLVTRLCSVGRVLIGRFPFNKNSGLKFRKFYVPNGTVHSGCTDPTQATARLVIVLVSRIKKSGTRDNSFVQWKGTFRSDRPKWPDRSKWTMATFKTGSEYSGRTKPKWSVPFDVPTEISGILGWMENAQGFCRSHQCKCMAWKYQQRSCTLLSVFPPVCLCPWH